MRGYYSLSDGRMASMPFNSSTAVMWYNKDAFRKAGLDPDKAPATWQEVRKAAETIKAKDAAPVAMTTSWPTWIQLEQYSALHNLPFATKSDGFDGLDARTGVQQPRPTSSTSNACWRCRRTAASNTPAATPRPTR